MVCTTLPDSMVSSLLIAFFLICFWSFFLTQHMQDELGYIARISVMKFSSLIKPKRFVKMSIYAYLQKIAILEGTLPNSYLLSTTWLSTFHYMTLPCTFTTWCEIITTRRLPLSLKFCFRYDTLNSNRKQIKQKKLCKWETRFSINSNGNLLALMIRDFIRLFIFFLSQSFSYGKGKVLLE